MVTSSGLLGQSRFVREVHQASAPGVAARAAEVARRWRYDWVVVTEDGLLGEIARLPIPLEERLALLPVAHPNGLPHLHSKIGLSQALERHGLRTPAYAVARTVDEALKAASRIGFPLILKADASCGGKGAFACATAEQLPRLAEVFDGRPVLVQQWIEGRKFDADPLYLRGQLVRTAVAYTQSSRGPFGVSKIRSYVPPALVRDALLQELAQIGQALHAHGFANVTAIEDAAGRRHYFEADMGPNVWADHGRFVGCDMAESIRAWFRAEPLPPVQGSSPLQRPLPIPHVARMSPWELLRHPLEAWRYRPSGDAWLVFLLTARHAVPARLRRALRARAFRLQSPMPDRP